MNRNARGEIYGTSKVRICQLAYRQQNMIYKCYILRIYQYSTFPCQLLELFQDETISFLGIVVGGDISKIGRDFHCIATMKNIKRVINLGKFARASKK